MSTSKIDKPMTKIVFNILSLTLLISSCQTPRHFQIECNSVSNDATYVVDVSVESNIELSNLGTTKLYAIDAVLFRGITGSNCVTQKSMLTQAKSEVNNNQLIKNIYGRKNGYDRYISNIAFVSSTRLTNTSKPITQFKYRVSINKELLRKDLTNSGLIKTLNSGF